MCGNERTRLLVGHCCTEASGWMNDEEDMFVVMSGESADPSDIG